MLEFEQEEQMQTEIEIQSQVSHPHILSLERVYSDEQHTYLVMDYIPLDFFSYVAQNAPVNTEVLA